MKYYCDLTKYDLSVYKEYMGHSIDYYNNVIKEYNNKSFYLGLFMAVQLKRIISNPTDINEINLAYEALEINLGKQGTQWDEMFFKFKNWKHNYIDTK